MIKSADKSSNTQASDSISMHVEGCCGSMFGMVRPTCSLPKLLCSVPKAHLAEGRVRGTLQLPSSVHCLILSANLLVITVMEHPESNKARTRTRLPSDPRLPAQIHAKKGVRLFAAAPPVMSLPCNDAAY